MPFASLWGAVNFLRNSYSSSYPLKVLLHSDITADQFELYNQLNLGIYIESDKTKRTITTGGIITTAGLLHFKNIKLVAASNAAFILKASGFYKRGQIIIGSSVEFSGTVTEATVISEVYGIVLVGATSGSVTGKRYICRNCGRILTYGKGANAIPGSVAGTCDATSTYF